MSSSGSGDSSAEEYEVEKILGEKKGKKGVILYDVKWKNYEEGTWEPAENLDSCPEILAAYKQRKVEEEENSKAAASAKKNSKESRKKSSRNRPGPKSFKKRIGEDEESDSDATPKGKRRRSESVEEPKRSTRNKSSITLKLDSDSEDDEDDRPLNGFIKEDKPAKKAPRKKIKSPEPEEEENNQEEDEKEKEGVLVASAPAREPEQVQIQGIMTLDDFNKNHKKEAKLDPADAQLVVLVQEQDAKHFVAISNALVYYPRKLAEYLLDHVSMEAVEPVMDEDKDEVIIEENKEMEQID